MLLLECHCWGMHYSNTSNNNMYYSNTSNGHATVQTDLTRHAAFHIVTVTPSGTSCGSLITTVPVNGSKTWDACGWVSWYVCVVYWYWIQYPLHRSGCASQSRVICIMCVCVCVNVCICALKSRGLSFPGQLCLYSLRLLPFKTSVKYHTSSYRPFHSSASLSTLKST
jgi:hypothetical protein